jgi:hypothetical protein
MKIGFNIGAGLVLALASFVITASANEDHHKDGASSATSVSTEAVVAYPLTTCVVSGDKLEDGEMGPPVNYVYKEEGKPDRLVRFCCKGCIKDFKKDPAKYLKMIDDAAAAKSSETDTGSGDEHAGHNH